MAKKSLEIKVPVIFDEGERHVITAKLSHNFPQLEESEEEAFDAFLEYLMRNIIKITGESGKIKFKLENPLSEEIPESTYTFTGVSLQLHMDLADDVIKANVLDLISQCFMMYQLPDDLPGAVKSIVSFVLTQYPGTDVAVVVAKKETEQKPESELEQDSKPKIEHEPEQGPELKTEPESET